MYSYHNTIKKRIKNGELINIVKIDNGTYLFAFIFNKEPIFRPIRYHSANKYLDILEKYQFKAIEKTD